MYALTLVRASAGILDTSENMPSLLSRTYMRTNQKTSFTTADLGIEVVQKRGLVFAKNRESQAFIERLEELAEAYDVDKNLLLGAIGKVLRHRVLTWLLSNVQPWKPWDGFSENS
uniref:Uncharacterized protein n=1 Tax=Glossina pallidipes TaxID=7398 RepID=A0A1A9ZSP0_GLOPL